MSKVCMIVGALMVAGGGAFGVYEYTNLFGNNPDGCCLMSKACCTVPQPCCSDEESSGCCPLTAAAKSDGCCEVGAACCPASPCCESPAAGAVAGPMAFFVSTKPAVKSACCAAGSTVGLDAVAGVAVSAK